MPLRASVIIPAYNAETTIAKAVQSALAQSFSVTEIIVGDDGSSDQTAALAEEAGARVLRLPRGNGAIARNAAAREASGDVLFFLDADDWWESGKVAAHMAVWDKVQPAVVFDRSTAIYETGQKAYWMGGLDRTGPIAERELLSHRAWPSGSGFSVLRESYWKVNGFNENLRKWQDVDFWLRCVHALGNGYCIAESYTNYLLVTGSVGKSTKDLEENLTRLRSSLSFLSESDWQSFSRYAYLQAAEFTPFPRSIRLFMRAGCQFSNRYYWKCVLSSLRRGAIQWRS